MKLNEWVQRGVTIQEALITETHLLHKHKCMNDRGHILLDILNLAQCVFCCGSLLFKQPTF